MSKHLIAASAALSILGAALPATAAVSLTSVASGYSQSFDNLASTGASAPWVNDSTLAGWSLYNTAGAAITSYVTGTGTGTAGAFYSFGAAGSSERALGGVGSNALSGAIVLALTNDTGLTLNGATVRFDGEQWRNSGNTAAQEMPMAHGFGADYATVSWSGPVTAWTSPVTGAPAGAVDGNSTGLVAGLSYTVTDAWTPGRTLWLRWTERNDGGSDHGLAIDNLQFSVTAVPEPETYALMLAGLAAIGMLARRRV